ncbi:MAG TPA: hypothetical protein VI306_13905 [Pyrinomonadaceae bacterium]
MNYFKIPLVVLLAIAFIGLVTVGPTNAGAQNQSTALERGYRTGYSDGYSAGTGDSGAGANRDYRNKDEYQRGDRSFNNVWGPVEDYRDGYQQGFELGYSAGYDHKEFDSTIPNGLHRRQDNGDTSAVVARPDNSSPTNPQDNNAIQPSGSLAIPRNTVLTLELMTPMSTDVSQRNDPFKARVVQPAEFSNLVVEGRIADVKRPGKVKGVAELQLSFERLVSPDNRSTDLHAELLEVVALNSDSPTEVDSEGAIRGRDSTKDDVTKVGAATGIGAVIGAIAGGGKGAAIGAIIGGGAGTAGVMSQKGHDFRLEQGQQIKIRVSTDTVSQ